MTPGPSAPSESAVRIPVGEIRLDADLTLPGDALGLVIFAHGSGSSRKSPRNRAVASALNAAGFGTLLLDLLTVDEDQYDRPTARFRFDIPLLASRLVGAIDWASDHPATRPLPVVLFGASTGAAAALVAAAARPDQVRSVVSRGGRPDLAGQALPHVRAPTLLMVGGLDTPVIAMNQAAAREIRCEHEVSIVPGATHLFEEAGALEQVASEAIRWFRDHLAPIPAG